MAAAIFIIVFWLLLIKQLDLGFIRKLFKRVFRLRIRRNIFSRTYLEVRELYMQEFRSVPRVIFMDDIDTDKIPADIEKGIAGKVKMLYMKSYFDWKDKKIANSMLIYKLSGNMMIEIGYQYIEILFDSFGTGKAKELVDIFSAYKIKVTEEEAKINIINYQDNELCLKALDIKPVKLDIGLFYNDDFASVDTTIRERLMKEDDKGIVLLHGLPGTGKTTYLRYLVGALKKKVLFLSPSVAGNLSSPELIDLLLNNTNSVLVIEDAENIIRDRRYNSNSSVSNLLNISDGLLSDCLNVQIICTFNSSLTFIDDALMRRGRLIARYEFGKLETAKAQALSDHLGLDRVITKPMTLAEISNPDEASYTHPQVSIMGFRRELIEN